jgi:hypothetical protein
VVSFKIEGLPINIDKQPSYTRNLKDERETATVVITNSRMQRYEPYSKVELEDKTYEQYVIENDRVVETRSGLYQHTLKLVENMARFDVVIPASRSHQTRTGFAITLGDVLEKYKRECLRFHYVNIDFVAGDYLNAIISPKEYDQEKLSNIISDLFRTINAYAKVYYDYVDEKWYFFPQFINQRNVLIDSNRQAYISQQNAYDYATKVRTSVKNGVFNNPTPLYYPSDNGYITPRSSGFVMRESEYEYVLDSNTALVKWVGVKVQFQLTSTGEFITEYIDITKYTVTQEEYDGLLIVRQGDLIAYQTTQHKSNCVILDLEDNKISNLFDTEGRLLGFNESIDILRNAALSATFDKYGRSDVTNFNISDLEDRELRIQYVKQRNNDLTVQRISNVGMNQATAPYTQQSSVIDTGKYMDSLGLIVNRMGNQEKTIIKTFSNDETLYEVGDYDSEGFVITEAKYTIHNNDYYGEFVLTKNLANTNADYALRYELTPYTVSAKKLTTNVIDEMYVIANTEQMTFKHKFTTSGLDSLFGIFTNLPKQKIEFGIFKQTNQTFDNDKALHMPVDTQVGANTLAFNVQFKEPLVAGKYKEVDGSTVRLQPILYTADIEDDYILNDFSLYLSNGANIEDDGFYPIIDETQAIKDNALTINEQMPIDLGINDSFAYTLAVHGVTYNDKVGIGHGFVKYNPLYQDDEYDMTLYKSTYPYSIADKKLRDVDTIVTGGTFNFTNATKKLTVTGSEAFDYWALAVNDDIVVWGNDTKTVYFGLEQELYPEFEPQTFLSFSYYAEVEPYVTHDFVLQNVTILEESFTFTTNLELNYNLQIGDFTLTTTSKTYTLTPYINKSLTINNVTLVEESFIYQVAPTINKTLEINNVLNLSESFVLLTSLQLNKTLSIDNVTLSFSYLGSTPQSYDRSFSYYVGGEDESTACPSITATRNYFENTANPESYDIGDVIRVNSYRWEYDPIFGGSWVFCNDIYYEVVVS